MYALPPGPWAMDPDTLRSIAAQAARLDSLTIEAAVAKAPVASAQPQVIGNVAVVELVGPLSKYPTILQAVFGGTSTLAVATAIRNAAANAAVKVIVLLVDSPGGTVAGTDELATAIAAARQAKPVVALVSDRALSAAFWLASQATEIVANAGALIGSIGTYTTLVDSSGQAASDGIKVHVIRAGEYKGIGIDGAPITEQQLAEAQRIVDSLNQRFLDAVASGRGMSPAKVRTVADGRAWIAADALKLGLIDRIGIVDNELAALMQRVAGEARQAKLLAAMSERERAIYTNASLSPGIRAKIEAKYSHVN